MRASRPACASTGCSRDLYDFDVTVVSIDDTSQALVSRLALQGVAFDSGERILKRYLGALQWKP